MNYDAVVTITQSLALVFFVTLFVVIVAYVFWPGNRRKFEDAAKLPFEPGEAPDQNGKR
ncbi:MAG: cbb3-type cytochrome c oxidase subunit 3 [Hyphomicrobiales bacterium]|nr:cbb3-type cytochrome c oxidase subunit 3 [Hyphomicrobiales bacterium]